MTEEDKECVAGEDPDMPPADVLLELPGAVYTTDAKGYLQFYNRAAGELWGRRPVIGVDRWHGGLQIFDTKGIPMTADEIPMARALALRQALPPTELIVERPDGSRRLIRTHPKPYFGKDGQLLGGINLLVDITDLRQELRQTEEDYHSMVSEIEDYAILRLDVNGIITNWNIGAEKIKGYKETEIVGRHFRVFYTPEDRNSGLPERLIEEAQRVGKAVHEGWRQRKDGSLFWGSIVITALHDESGRVIGFVKVTRDLTARKLAEDKLKRYSADLEFQNKELQQFAYAAAHDMKEPLRKVFFYCTALQESLGERLSAKEEEYLRRTAGAVQRMQTLIDDLLTYSKASAESTAYEWVNLGLVVDNVRANHGYLLEDTRGTIEWAGLPTVWGVPFQLEQLFANLLVNSIKYRHPDRRPMISIGCTMASEPPRGYEREWRSRQFYKISVQDNGMGFDDENAGKIFEIFQRLHSQRDIAGTGIGLAICKKVVQNHGGLIAAHGVPGQGAEFSIYLPVERR